MQHQEIDPPKALRDIIESFWYTGMELGELPVSFEVVPDGYAEIIFHFGSGCSLSTADGVQPLSSPFLVGLLNQPALFTAQNRLELLGIRCFPWTVFEVLRLPAGQDGVRALAHPIAHLQAGLIAEALAEITQAFLAARLNGARDRLLGQAGEAMRASGGALPVSQVAAAAHATVRTLERKFKQAAGYTVKDVSSLMRFEQVRLRIWQQPTASLASLALELGYADQAHLGREFKRYSGTTPAAFARKAKHWQQTVSTDFVAFLLA